MCRAASPRQRCGGGAYARGEGGPPMGSIGLVLPFLLDRPLLRFHVLCCVLGPKGS